MKRPLKAMRAVCETIFVLTLMGGCSSVVQKEEQPAAVAVAVNEAHRRGWQKVEVESYKFTDGHWRVYVFRRPLKQIGSVAVVDVSIDGSLLSFYMADR